jgi:intein-encoded DNA endonuclease-like protein
MTNQYKSYSSEDINYIKKNYGKILVKEIAEKLGRKEHNIRYLMYKLRKQDKTKITSNLDHSPEQIIKMKEKNSKKLIKGYDLPSNELAYIIGVLNGDGSLNLRAFRPNRFALITIDYDFLLNVKKNLEKWSGLITKEYKYSNKKYWSYKQGFHYELNLNSVKAIKFLRKYYISINQQKAMKNIKKLLKNNRQLQIEFIKGFFDSEGSIRINGRIAIDNSKKEIITYISYLLKKLKINSKINYSEQNKKHKNVKYIIKDYRLWIQKKEDIKKFCNLINSSIKRKQNRISQFS